MDKTIKIHVLECGQVQVDKALPFHENSLNPIAFTGIFRPKKHQLTLPVFAFLIEHPKGLVLIDTGWHTDVRVDQIRHLGRLHYMINKAILPAGQAISEQLEQRGIKPQDLDYVILSHLHSDHASGLKLVRDAKNIMVSEPEWKAAQKDKLRYIHHMWDGITVKAFPLTPSEYGPVHQSFDLFGDNSVVFVHVPGHCPGLIATIIQRNGKFVLLTGDSGYAKKSWEQMIHPGVSGNKKQTIASLQWIKKLSQQPNCIEVLATHDPEVNPHSIEL